MTKNNHANEQKIRSTKSEKWRHTQFNWNCTNEWTQSRFEVIVTSYGRNNNLDDDIKNIAGRIPEPTRSVITSKAKLLRQPKPLSFCLDTFTFRLTRFHFKIGKNCTTVKTRNIWVLSSLDTIRGWGCTGGGFQRWEGVYGCTGPLRPELCAGVGIGVGLKWGGLMWVGRGWCAEVVRGGGGVKWEAGLMWGGGGGQPVKL